MRHILLLFLFILLLLLAPLFPQEKVVESVSVEWWVLPLFALDNDGNSILDLKDSDVELLLNDRKMTEFVLYKRAFNVAEVSAEKKKTKEKPLFEKKKMIFLLFDMAFTSSENLNLSKQAAKNLVMKSEDNTLFSVMAINPLTGLVYVGGPLPDKQQIVKMIDEKIKSDPNTKDIYTVLFMTYSTQVSGNSPKEGERSRLDENDFKVLQEQRSSNFRKANERFFKSFESLYQALNSIKDNKYVYLFSEGVSLFARQTVMHGTEEYLRFIKQTAGYLGRCGAVLFIINPSGSEYDSVDIGSGEDSLRALARESGGKYMEGEEKNIANQIENMTRAYYEIAFPDQESFKEGIRQITIRSLRKGVNIHTLLNLERSKQYSEMNNIEREVVALNLLNPSPLYYSPLKTGSLKMEKISETEDNVSYRVKLPDNFKGKSLELFKVKKVKTDQEMNDNSIEKEQIIPTGRPLEITVKKKEESSQRLVLVNETDNIALVQGIFDAQAERESILAGMAASFNEQIERMKPGEITELERITANTMSYCTRLSQAVFHYICKETVSEIVDDVQFLRSERGTVPDYNYNFDFSPDMYRPRASNVEDVQEFRAKLTNKYVNDYQLISNKGRLTEQRKLLKGTIKQIAGKEALLRLDAFISKNTSLIPLSLLGPGLQDRFNFRFIKYDTIKGVKTAVIESFPKDPAKTQSVYGKLWVDLEDFSIVRISVNPVSIGGYTEILKRAKYYNAILILTCDIDFFKQHGGIRFPTEVVIRELYNGGVELKKLVGQPIWERSKTTYTFSDYQFFEVEAAASEEEITK